METIEANKVLKEAKKLFEGQPEKYAIFKRWVYSQKWYTVSEGKNYSNYENAVFNGECH